MTESLLRGSGGVPPIEEENNWGEDRTRVRRGEVGSADWNGYEFGGVLEGERVGLRGIDGLEEAEEGPEVGRKRRS